MVTGLFYTERSQISPMAQGAPTPAMHSGNANGQRLVFPQAPLHPSHNMWLWCSGTVLQRCNGLCNGNVFGQMGEASADVLNYAFYS